MCRAAAQDNFRWFDANGVDPDDPLAPGGLRGMLRDSANAAMVALMYADLPGVTSTEAQLARCMAKQNVDFIIGDNTDARSYVVGLGCAPSLWLPACASWACVRGRLYVLRVCARTCGCWRRRLPPATAGHG
jgi:hypothetical protein